MVATNTELPVGWRDAVDRFLFDWMTDAGVPSIAVALVDSEGIRHRTAFGSRHLADNRPATPETLYAVGSVTKSFTATAVLQLVEAGEIELTDSPGLYTDAAFDGIDDVTLHELLCHSSGLPSLAVSEMLIAQQTDQADPVVPLADRSDFYQFLNGAGDHLVDDDRWMYSNSGYMVLADVVSSVRDRPFASVVKERILQPLGMHRSVMLEDEGDLDGDVMTPYRREDSDDRWQSTALPVRELSHGPGGLFTSVSELGQYLRMYLNGGEAPDGERVLRRDSIERMTDGYMDTPHGPYGYGWRTAAVSDISLIGHGGSVGVATAFAGWAPELDLGIAVACNASPGYGLAAVGKGTLLAAMGRDPVAEQGVLAKQRRQDLLSGTYRSYRDVRTATVEPVGGTLQFKLDEPLPGRPRTLVFDEQRGDSYRYLMPGDDDGTVTVEFVQDGDVIELYYDRWRLEKQC